MRFAILILALLFASICMDYVVFWATVETPQYQPGDGFTLGDRRFRHPHPEWDEMTTVERAWLQLGVGLTRFHDSPRLTSPLVRSLRSYTFLRSRQLYPS